MTLESVGGTISLSLPLTKLKTPQRSGKRTGDSDESLEDTRQILACNNTYPNIIIKEIPSTLHHVSRFHFTDHKPPFPPPLSPTVECTRYWWKRAELLKVSIRYSKTCVTIYIVLLPPITGFCMDEKKIYLPYAEQLRRGFSESLQNQKNET